MKPWHLTVVAYAIGLLTVAAVQRVDQQQLAQIGRQWIEHLGAPTVHALR